MKGLQPEKNTAPCHAGRIKHRTGVYPSVCLSVPSSCSSGVTDTAAGTDTAGVDNDGVDFTELI